MKVLFISYNGALEPLIQSQGIPYLKGLSNRGMDCILLSFEKAQKDKKIFKEKINMLKKELEDCGIKWYRLQYHKSPIFFATLFDIFTGIMLSFYIVISKKINIIHARATVSATIGYVVARLTGKKFIFDERGLMAEEYIDGGMWKRESILYKVTLYLEKKLLSEADAIVMLTENIKGFLINTDYLPQSRNGKRLNISVIPCCVDTGRFNNQVSRNAGLKERYGLTGKFVFLYIGSLGTWYLLEEMIDFFLTAKTIINNAHFLVLTHISKEMVRNSWRKRGLSFNDITIDEVEFEDMPEHIKLADIGIFFIKPVFSKKSSCPIKFAEYLACGLPVVINAGIGDTDKVVERNKLGVVIKEFNKESYSASIIRLLELMKERGSANRCRKIAEDIFSLDIGISRYFELYNKVLLKN